ncbi:unnamed protein product [Arabis nemorensis]|uniref:MBD domain-containing protein n=1 Tax=Arabis nemorensis TaxID=586526 RepID=A0A565CSB6_9BRAS|nr:unnamed protein product [Arabis nemorensis]
MQTRSSSSASAELVPLGVQFPASHRHEAQLQIVDPTSFRGKLPPGWSVVNKSRSSSPTSNGSVYTYYVERRTGKRFRSLVSVERYLNESGNHTDQQPLMLLQYHRVNSKDFNLPAGWIVEKKPRRNSTHIDRTYIEPGTGNKFRSMAAVERYLQATGNSTLDSISMERSERLSLTGIQTEVIDQNPPEKVKWVLTGPDGNMFTANMSGSDVSSSVKQKWSEAFVSLIQDRS